MMFRCWDGSRFVGDSTSPRAVLCRRQLVRGVAGADGKLKAQIPWLRVFVEGVVIVGSILLALGIHDRQGRGLNVSLNVRMR